MKRKHIFLIYALILSVIFTLTSCNQTEKEINNSNNTQIESDSSKNAAALTGIYEKNIVSLDENFNASQTMAYANGQVYLAGTMTDGENYIQTNAIVNTQDFSVTYEQLPFDSYFSDMAVSGENRLFIVSEFDRETFIQTYKLYCAKNSEILWEKPLLDIIELPESFWGNVYIDSVSSKWYIGGDKTIAVLSIEGELENIQNTPDVISGMDCDTNGNLHIWGNGFHYISDENGELSNNEEWQQAFKGIPLNKIYFGAGYDFYYFTENALMGHDVESGKSVSVMNWVNSGTVPSYIYNIKIISPETILCCGSDGIGSATGLWKYTKATDIESSERQIVRVSYMEDGHNIVPMAAVKFNSTQNKYQIVCEEYSTSYKEGEYASILEGFDGMVLNGTMGDIIVTSDLDSINKYSQKNLLVDLYTLMDDEFSADNIFGCVRMACETDGKLYSMPQDFYLTAYAAKTANLNFDENQVWNTEAFIKLSESLGENQQILPFVTKSSLYNTLIESVLSECIDFENKSFNSDTFSKFLTYLNSLPENPEKEFEHGQNCYITDEVILYDTMIDSYSTYIQTICVFGETPDSGENGVKILGYPSAQGGTAKLFSNKYYAIAESSSVKDGAFEFLKYLFSPECTVDEMRGMRNIPSLKTTLEAWNESESKMYHYFLYDSVGRIMSDIEPITEEYAGGAGICVGVGPELIDQIYDFLDSVKVYPAIPQPIIDIVNEEMSAFLASGKTADETVKVINSRVNVYLSEQ